MRVWAQFAAGILAGRGNTFQDAFKDYLVIMDNMMSTHFTFNSSGSCSRHKR